MKTILNQIYSNLQKGLYYYETRKCPHNEGYYDNIVLWVTQYNNIGWEHYGRAASKNTKEDLKWIIEEIFELTPEEFINKYKLSEDTL